jgi:homoserine dehydrogenase
MRKIHVGLLGCGTVGTGVARLLQDNREMIRARVGAELILKRVADIDPNRDRGIRFGEGVMTTDACQVVDDPQIDIILEMIGGEGIARDLILRATKTAAEVTAIRRS